MKRLVSLVTMFAFLLVPVPAIAGSGHYLSGSEGIKVATLPGPGLYWKTYFFFYDVDHYRQNGSSKDKDMKLSSFAIANRFIHMTELEFLGAQIGWNVVVPVAYNDFEHKSASFLNDTSGGLGDILLEIPYLSWHGQQWDALLGMSFYFPTGKYDAPRMDKMADPGKGYWTFMLGGGGTYYFDAAKTWTVSIMTRYEMHTKQKYTEQRIGDSFHFEWGAAKTIPVSTGMWDLGFAGYCEWQTKRNTEGKASEMALGRGKYESYAAGPEIVYTHAPWGMAFSLRSLWEFGVRNGSEGNLTVLSITKAF